MDQSLFVKPGAILEKLRSDHKKIQELTDSFLAGLESLEQQNARQRAQLIMQNDNGNTMKDELNHYHMVSLEAHGKLDQALRVNNELRAELQGYKALKGHLGLQYDQAHRQQIELSTQLHLAQREIHGLRLQVDSMKWTNRAPLEALPSIPRLSTPSADALPTPPLAPGIAEQPRTPTGGRAIQIRPQMTENRPPKLETHQSDCEFDIELPKFNDTKVTAEPSQLHPATNGLKPTTHRATNESKPKTNGIARGGQHIDESFARIKKNLEVAIKTNGSDLEPAYHASRGGSPSHRDFSWPQATLIKDAKDTLDPECVNPPAATSRLVSKLNPLSQEFVPAMSHGQPQQGVTSPHKRVPKIEIKSESMNFPNNSNGTFTMDHETSSSASPQPSMTIRKEPQAVQNATSPPKRDATVAKGGKSIPPHLRGLQPKATAPTILPNAPPSTPSNQKTADVAPKKTNVAPPFTSSNEKTGDIAPKETNTAQPEAATMKAWLDAFEKRPGQGQSVPDEPSDSRTPPSEKLIDLDVEDAEKPSNVESTPGFSPEAIRSLLAKAKITRSKSETGSEAIESLLATLQNLPEEAQDGSELTAVLQGLLTQYRSPQDNVPNVQNSEAVGEDEGYTTSSPTDPYLKFVGRPKTTSASKGQGAVIAVPEDPRHDWPPSTERTAFEGDTDNNEDETRVFDFKAKLPARKDEKSIAADFLTAYSSKLSSVKSKYGRSAENEKGPRDRKSQTEEPALYDNDSYLDPGYAPSKTVGTHVLGDLLDWGTKLMIMDETPHSRGQDKTVDLDWKPAIKHGKRGFVL